MGSFTSADSSTLERIATALEEIALGLSYFRRLENREREQDSLDLDRKIELEKK